MPVNNKTPTCESWSRPLVARDHAADGWDAAYQGVADRVEFALRRYFQSRPGEGAAERAR